MSGENVGGLIIGGSAVVLGVLVLLFRKPLGSAFGRFWAKLLGRDTLALDGLFALWGILAIVLGCTIAVIANT